tara:strand:- start:3385 stop:4272 length:888 start_codon:yes stop_codon:yes gene_type:complete
MTSTLGSDNNNGGIVGPTNDAQAAADLVTQITGTGTYTPVAATGNVLVVAGGGRGGNNGGGGGGGGGSIFYPDYPMPGSDLAVVIGAAGADSEFNDGASASLELIAKGGGNGGTQGGGYDGGCGGGGGHQGNPNNSPGGPTTQVPTMPAPLQPFGFGNTGGTWNGPPSGAGGGGSGGAAANQNTTGGAAKNFGDSPTTSSDSAFAPYGESGYFAGGAGGANGNAASGAEGGAGNSNQAGTANTGGGGGGGLNPPQAGKDGGSGVILVHEVATAQANGVWNMQTAYKWIKAASWPT